MCKFTVCVGYIRTCGVLRGRARGTTHGVPHLSRLFSLEGGGAATGGQLHSRQAETCPFGINLRSFKEPGKGEYI